MTHRPIISLLPLAYLLALGDVVMAEDPAGAKKDPDAAAETANGKPEPPAESPQIAEDGSMKLGLVSFDPKTREIRFPASVNMIAGIIEFPVTHINGRVHEAIYTTDTLPLHIETVMRLLRYPRSREVFPTYPGVDMENPPPWDQWPAPVFSDPQPASHVQCLVVWKDADGNTVERDIRTQLVRAGENLPDPTVLPDEVITLDRFAPHWVYTGSAKEHANEVDYLDGCIIGVLLEEDSIINTTSGGEIHEYTWLAHTGRIAPLDTDVTIVMRPVGPAPPAKPDPTEKQP